MKRKDKEELKFKMCFPLMMRAYFGEGGLASRKLTGVNNKLYLNKNDKKKSIQSGSTGEKTGCFKNEALI